MTDYFSVVRRFALIVLLKFYLVCYFVYLIRKHPDWLSRFIPGRFGLSLRAEFTGNYFLAALLLVSTAILILLTSSYSLIQRLPAGGAGPNHYLSSTAQTIERKRFRSLLRFFLLGVVLLFAGFSLSIYGFTRASPMDWPLFQAEQGILPNQAVTLENSARFTADQVSAGVTIGLSEHFRRHVSGLTVNSGNIMFVALTFLFRGLALSIAFILLFVLGSRITRIFRRSGA